MSKGHMFDFGDLFKKFELMKIGCERSIAMLSAMVETLDQYVDEYEMLIEEWKGESPLDPEDTESSDEYEEEEEGREYEHRPLRFPKPMEIQTKKGEPDAE